MKFKKESREQRIVRGTAACPCLPHGADKQALSINRYDLGDTHNLSRSPRNPSKNITGQAINHKMICGVLLRIIYRPLALASPHLLIKTKRRKMKPEKSTVSKCLKTIQARIPSTTYSSLIVVRSGP